MLSPRPRRLGGGFFLARVHTINSLQGLQQPGEMGFFNPVPFSGFPRLS